MTAVSRNCRAPSRHVALSDDPWPWKNRHSLPQRFPSRMDGCVARVRRSSGARRAPFGDVLLAARMLYCTSILTRPSTRPSAAATARCCGTRCSRRPADQPARSWRCRRRHPEDNRCRAACVPAHDGVQYASAEPIVSATGEDLREVGREPADAGVCPIVEQRHIRPGRCRASRRPHQ